MDLTLVTILIIIATVGISMHAFSNATFMQEWLHKPYRVKNNKEWKRLVTNGFIHADWMHLFGNMLTLFFFGTNERLHSFFYSLTGTVFAGVLLFVVFYLVAIVVSSLPAQRKYGTVSGYSALGASGAVSAVMVAAVFLDPLTGIQIFPFSLLFAHGIPGFLFVGLYLWYSNYMSNKHYDNVGHDAHYYGALFGLAVVVILKPSSVLDFYDAIKAYIQYIL